MEPASGCTVRRAVGSAGPGSPGCSDMTAGPPSDTLRFSLRLTPSEVLAYYDGAVDWVQVRATDGRRLRFPFRLLRPHVTADGVAGTFEMDIDSTGSCMELRRVGPD